MGDDSLGCWLLEQVINGAFNGNEDDIERFCSGICNGCGHYCEKKKGVDKIC